MNLALSARQPVPVKRPQGRPRIHPLKLVVAPHAPRGLSSLDVEVKQYLSRQEFRDGVAPSIREIAAALGKMHSHVHAAIDRLVERGHVARNPGRARSLRVIQHCCPHCGGDLSAAPVHPASENGEVS